MNQNPRLEHEIRTNEQKVQLLDTETQAILDSIRHKDTRLRITISITFAMLFVLGLIGIFYQNKLASENQQNINCMLKLLATPVKPGHVRSISDPNSCKVIVK